MERRIAHSTPLAVEFDRAHGLLGADPAGVIGPLLDRCDLEVGDPRRSLGELAVPLVLRHRDGPLHHLVADLRLAAHGLGSELSLAGHYLWQPSQSRYGSGLAAHRAVHVLVANLLTGTARELEARATR